MTHALDWKQAHQALIELSRARGALDADEGTLLLAALRSGTHQRLGYASFAEYIERSFGHGPRWTQERLRVAEALERLPRMKAALGAGELVWSALRELTRAATPDNEAQWLEVAAGRSVRDIERLVAGRAPGDRPDDPPEPNLIRHVLRFEVTAEVLATFRQAVGVLKRQSGGGLSDEEALLLMARHTLAGSTGAETDGVKDAGRSNYQLGITVCEACRRGWQHGRGELVELSPEALAMAECDAVHLGCVDASSTAERDGESAAAANDNTGREGNTTHVGKPPQARQRTRATRSVPPATRRKVLHRDGHRCSVPGCRNALHLDVHHLQPRADGGDHAAKRLVTLCSVHHAQLHRGRLLVDGAPGALRFRHADGSPYGEAPSPLLIDLYHKLHRALRFQGFGETHVRRTLERLRRECASDPVAPNLESLLRRAFALLVA